MDTLIIQPSPSYKLLDSGDGYTCEKIGNNVIVRPNSNAVWRKGETDELWHTVQATFTKRTDGKNHWVTQTQFKEPWLFIYHLPSKSKEKGPKITCSLRLPTGSKNVGVFPEQASHWDYMARLIIQSRIKQPKILNLFGHTGAATLVAAAAGAEVCHVDASQAAISWAKQNQTLSNMEPAPIRWIVDDCTSFVRREVKRGKKYDGIILDPPAFGRDNKGNVFEFEKRIYELLKLCKEVLSDKPLFLIFNGYSMGYSATVLKNLLLDFFPDQDIEYGELQIAHEDGKRELPCSLYARFCSK
jgi:23S rRNA (cytosine1962-C5)-methyltransferase